MESIVGATIIENGWMYERMQEEWGGGGKKIMESSHDDFAGKCVWD